MRFEIVGRHVTVTDAMRARIEKKLSFLEKYLLIDSNTIARVVCKVYPNTQKVEITIPTKVGQLRAEVEHEDFYAALDLAIDKLEDQIRRQKTRLSRRHKDKLAKAFVEQDTSKLKKEDVLVRTKTIDPEEMDVEEAIMRMEMLGHSFFIYNDVETEAIAVVYKRNDGRYGLIETE
ncbi:MAG: ribosome-associated translation inhibitor RaiA [Erysipelotrichaceae bacterium]|jgi:putative sigma-54 modulation protein|nr:ribosome-associated translation inhibitor RaiA [Erysipelotrichaceae bacterium]HCY07196.1 ribosome-associated translation inhibitor RaiA [Erysipelotrichaceae bacterium]